MLILLYRSYLTNAASGAASYIPGLGASAPSAEGATDAAKEGAGAAQKGLGTAGYVVFSRRQHAFSLIISNVRLGEQSKILPALSQLLVVSQRASVTPR